jgi:hypothetical protein
MNRMAHQLRIGHRANIFSAKFMPYTADTKVVCCAGDSEIRVFDIHYSQIRAVDKQAKMDRVYVCHRTRAKRIVPEDNSFCFLSCSEDGKS